MDRFIRLALISCWTCAGCGGDAGDSPPAPQPNSLKAQVTKADDESHAEASAHSEIDSRPIDRVPVNTPPDPVEPAETQGGPDPARLEEVRRELSVGADPTTLLFETVVDDSVSIDTALSTAQLLVEAGAQLNARKNHRSLLHVAADAGRTELVEFVVVHGAALDATDTQDRTPLFAAIRNVERERIMGLLLDHGADIDAVDRDGTTSLMEAVARGRVDIVRLLLARGADVDILDRHGNNALAPAVRGRAKRFQNDDPTDDIRQIVALLLDASCDPYHANQSGQTAIDLAQESPVPDVFDELIPELDAKATHSEAIASPFNLPPYPMRVWKTEDGRFTTIAQFIRCDPRTVFLKNEQGETLAPPKSKLSKADQAYLATVVLLEQLVHQLTEIGIPLSASANRDQLEEMVNAARAALDNEQTDQAQAVLSQIQELIDR